MAKNNFDMEIPDIKSRLSLAQVLAHYNLSPDRNNRLCCPFHPDKTPSFQVYPKTDTAYCFSSNCKTHGKSLDVIDFVMWMEKTDKHTAILKAQELAGIPNQSTPKQKPTNGQEISRSAVLTKMFSYFKNGLASSNSMAVGRRHEPLQTWIPTHWELHGNTRQAET